MMHVGMELEHVFFKLYGCLADGSGCMDFTDG